MGGRLGYLAAPNIYGMPPLVANLATRTAWNLNTGAYIALSHELEAMRRPRPRDALQVDTSSPDIQEVSPQQACGNIQSAAELLVSLPCILTLNKKAEFKMKRKTYAAKHPLACAANLFNVAARLVWPKGRLVEQRLQARFEVPRVV